jgi:hypothetical protein
VKEKRLKAKSFIATLIFEKLDTKPFLCYSQNEALDERYMHVNTDEKRWKQIFWFDLI